MFFNKRIYKSLFEFPWNNSTQHCKVYYSSNEKDELIDTAFSRSVGNGSISHNLLGYCLIIMRTSLVVAGVKLCMVCSESGGSGKS